MNSSIHTIPAQQSKRPPFPHAKCYLNNVQKPYIPNFVKQPGTINSISYSIVGFTV